MIFPVRKSKSAKVVFLGLLLLACAAAIVFPAWAAQKYRENDLYPFSDQLVELTDGWTLTDSAGASRALVLPVSLNYGTDGDYALETTLPANKDLILEPVLAIYSNYMDISVWAGEKLVYEFPRASGESSKVTGNTWHFIRVRDYGGLQIRIELKCQLDSHMTYLLKAPLLGSKATFLNRTVKDSALSLLVTCIMTALSIVLSLLYFGLGRKLKLNTASLYLALFAFAFAAFTYLESPYAKLVGPNGYAVYTYALLLLSLLPALLVGFFRNDVGEKLRPAATVLFGMCIANFLGQSLLHYTGLSNFRVMLPLTHGIILLTTVIMSLLLLLTDRKTVPGARRKLLSALPMAIGCIADIALVWLDRPSFNNSFGFTLGVAFFVLFQFVVFLFSYFRLYSLAIESKALRSLAYRDELTGLDNRNAYERHLKKLGSLPSAEGLGCIVADINRLKYINDAYGHHTGDDAIREMGRIFLSLTPENGRCYRTGGDEFVILLEGAHADAVQALVAALTESAEQRGAALSLPMSIAVSGDCYEERDGNIQDFIRRVDTMMYLTKRSMEGPEGCIPLKFAK